MARSLWRGARKRCPCCGRGRLFERWLVVRAPCDRCGAVVIDDEGDPWAFVVVLDRIFVLALVGVVYFQFGPPTTWGLGALFALITVLFVFTTPNRFGCCLGLVWALGRRHREAESASDSDVSWR